MTRSLTTNVASRVAVGNESAKSATVALSDLGPSVRKALALGLELLTRKAQVPHGQWRAWVRANFPLSLRTAQFYMQVTRRVQALRDRASAPPAGEGSS